jgi:hypothetical protein
MARGSKRKQQRHDKQSSNKIWKPVEDSSDTETFSFEGGYNGWMVPEAQVERVLEMLDPKSISAEEFYLRFVRLRKPCIFTGHLGAGNGWKATDLWTDKYLTSKAGEKTIRVEKRSNVGEKFGQGREVNMQFSAFLAHISQENDQNLYLTTQDLDEDKEGRPALMASPVSDLTDDFPLRPHHLIGNLIPFNMNIWMGNSKNGSSSGLHHDFHDNLYILLRGRKHFRLYAPSCAERMYTRGSIHQVHPNGLINYKERPPTRMDGADPMCMQAIDASDELQHAEDQLNSAQEELRTLESEGASREKIDEAKARISKAESRVEVALELVLEAEMDDDESEMAHESDDNAEEDSDSSDRAKEEQSAASKRTTNEKQKPHEEPLNFSLVNPELPLPNLKSSFPNFLHESVRPLFADVRAGEMLFLPAGWFHEVTSYSDEHGKADGAEDVSRQGGVHMAFNYWFHPPDTVNGTFEEPYCDHFWEKDWEKRN